MKAMVIGGVSDIREHKVGLRLVEIDPPKPGPGELLIRVAACGVCHTELDEIEGCTPPPFYPMIPGHQVVDRVEETGPGAYRHVPSDSVGVGWIYSSCGQCAYCRSDRDNHCHGFKATSRNANDGNAEFMTVPEDAAHKVPEIFTNAQAAPLLCAGAIGHRFLRLTGLKSGNTGWSKPTKPWRS